MARAGEWQLPQDAVTYVIWPIAKGHRPTLREARDRMDRLLAQGPTPDAYDFPYLRAHLTEVAA